MQVQKVKPGYKILKLNKFSSIIASEYPSAWNFLSLGDTSSGIFSTGIGKDKEAYGEGCLFVTVVDIFRDFTINPKKLDRVTLTEDEIENHQLLKDDLVIDRSSNVYGTAGYPSYFAGYDEPVVCSGFTYRYRPKKETWDSKFLTYQLMSYPIRKLVTSISTKSANVNVNQKSYKKIKIPCPTLKQQQKIVSILSNIDSLINQTQKIIKQTQKLKKGLMQKYLTKGIGHKKFKKMKWLFKKEIEIPESWKLIQVGDVAKIKGGKRLPKGKKFSKTKTLHPYIRVTDFKNGNIDLSNIEYLTDEVYSKISNYIISSKDVYISIAGTIGLVGLIPPQLDGANLTENAAKLCNLKDITKDYLAILLQSEYPQRQIISYLAQTSQPKLALFRIAKLKLSLPTIKEQEKITTIILNVDSIISEILSKKSYLENIKKGLMQKLLTGQIRA